MSVFPNASLGELMAGGETLRFRHEVTVDEGARPRRVSDVRVDRLHESDGSGGAVAVIDDVSEVLQLRERAERSDRLSALGEMAAGVAPRDP